jgi:hypothetical protein
VSVVYSRRGVVVKRREDVGKTAREGVKWYIGAGEQVRVVLCALPEGSVPD